MATADHPFLTKGGMTSLNALQPGDLVSIYAFEGVDYDPPTSRVLLTEADLENVYPGTKNGLDQALSALRRRGLLPLHLEHPALPFLIKLMNLFRGMDICSLTMAAGHRLDCMGRRKLLSLFAAILGELGLRRLEYTDGQEAMKFAPDTV
jgi:hypothetical protein